MIRVLISSVVLSFGMIAHGMSLEKSVPFKETSCEIGGVKAQMLLRFDKKIEPAENDFSGAPLVFLNSKKTHVFEPLTKPYPGDFSFVPVKEKSNCVDTQAFELNDHVIGILYSKDNRPFQEIYQVAVWDAKADRVLAKSELGAVAESFQIPNGFAFSKVVPRSDVDQLEMTSPSGRKMTAVDKDLKSLQTVTLKRNKLTIEFDPTLSFERNAWRRFFKDQDDFLKATGWNSKKKTFKNVVVYEATHFDPKESETRETCIALTDKRVGKLDTGGWKCLTERP